MDELAELRTQKDQAYWERNQLVLALSKLYPAWLELHPESDTDWEHDWRWIVFIEIETSELDDRHIRRLKRQQLSWHLHVNEVEQFSHLEQRLDSHSWDGHSTEEKYRRLSHIVNRWPYHVR